MVVHTFGELSWHMAIGKEENDEEKGKGRFGKVFLPILMSATSNL